MNQIWKRVSSIGLVVVLMATVLMSFPLISAAPPDKCEPWPECKDGEEPPADPVIAFNKGAIKKQPGGIAVMNEDGSRQTVIHSGGENPTWSPDGSSIAFYIGRNPDREIWAVDVAVVNDEPQGSNARRLADANACDGAQCDWPEWSPNGDVIAVQGNRYLGNPGIYLIPSAGLDGGERAEKIFTPSVVGDGVGYVAWKSDATQMAFWYGDRSGEIPVFSIKILDLTTSPAQVVKTLVEGDFTSLREISWARTKDVLSFAAVPSGGGTDSLHILDIDSGIVTTLTDDASDSPTWSPDDSHIAFDRTLDTKPGKGMNWQIVSIDVATGAETVLVEKSAWMPNWKR